jgi:hypothetical protein
VAYLLPQQRGSPFLFTPGFVVVPFPLKVRESFCLLFEKKKRIAHCQEGFLHTVGLKISPHNFFF